VAGKLFFNYEPKKPADCAWMDFDIGGSLGFLSRAAQRRQEKEDDPGPKDWLERMAHANACSV
jgi:hypothetical protein